MVDSHHQRARKKFKEATFPWLQFSAVLGRPSPGDPNLLRAIYFTVKSVMTASPDSRKCLVVMVATMWQLTGGLVVSSPSNLGHTGIGSSVCSALVCPS